jgi:uncharacterized repeat protein (TIGR03803 family)
MKIQSFLPIVAVVLCCAQTPPAQQPVFTILYSPTSPDAVGGDPTELFEAKPGLLYVLGQLMNNVHGSSVFSLASGGVFSPIYSLPAVTISAAFAQSADSSIYEPAFLGDTVKGNGGYYISFNLNGGGLQKYDPPSEWQSGMQIISAPPGVFYDILGHPQSGTAPELWALGRIDVNGSVTIVHQFSGTDGAPTGSNIVYGPDGNIYGVGNQQHGGVSPGFIYRITPTGAYSQVVALPSVSFKGTLPLLAASDGNLYGSFEYAGTNNTGMIYQVALDGKFQVVANFPSTGMIQPMTLMEASDGNIYGSSNSNYIFRYNMATQQLSSIYVMNPSGSQGHCGCQMIQGINGKIYGAAEAGGKIGIGTVFSLDIGLPAPKPRISQMIPAAAPVGQKILLWGQYLLGVTSVSFNGVPAASVQGTTGQNVYATVPVGATTGPITLTTPNGSVTTTQDFVVQ